MTWRTLAAASFCLVAATLSATAWGTTGTVLFQPIGYEPPVCQFGSSVMTGPVSSSTSNALSNPTVYLIFMGKNWGTTKQPAPQVASTVTSVKTILGSSYLSGIAQYGSNGLASYGGDYIDSCTNADGWTFTYGPDFPNSNNPAWYEVNRALTRHSDCPNANYTTWRAAAGNAIFVTIHSNSQGSSAFAGSNDWGHGPDNYLQGVGKANVLAHVIDNYAGQTNTSLDSITWTFSHELAERMSTGTGTLLCHNPGSTNAQIADGEPEVANYQARLGTQPPLPSPLVQAYWSVMDQAFIVPSSFVPDGGLDGSIAQPFPRMVFDGFWNQVNGGEQAFLRQGKLSVVYPPLNSSSPAAVIDTQMQAYTIDTNANIYGLTSSGQVKEYGAYPAFTPTPITGSPTTVASQIVAPRMAVAGGQGVVGSGLYMLASNSGAPQQVWQYTGAGTNWTPLTSTDVLIKPNGLAATVAYFPLPYLPQTYLFMLASGDGGSTYPVWEYSGSIWRIITGSNTNVSKIVVANNNLYMLASNNGGNSQVWIWSPPATWTPITPVNWPYIPFVDMYPYDIKVVGDVLFTEVTIGNSQQVAVLQYVPSPSPGPNPDNWTRLTGGNTFPYDYGFLVQDGAELFMNANNGGGYQIWEFEGSGAQGLNTTLGWTPLTQPSVYQLGGAAMSLSSAYILQMIAQKNGRAPALYKYLGQPNQWQ
jgi:hypothetical protein